MIWQDYLRILSLVGGRYFIIAGLSFAVFYILLKRKNPLKKIQAKFPKNDDYAREIGYSVITLFIFAAVPILLLKTPIQKFTIFYTDISKHGIPYFVFAFVLMIFVHDTYFYWMHRLMHHPKLFKILHLVHHKSTNPSPWAAYAFHPLEAVIEAGIFPVFLFIIPVHPIHLGVFFLFMIVYNVYGHLGFELYPKGFSKHPIGKWIHTSVNHNQHHQYFKGNYGLYFLIWDRLMGTIRSDYDARFEETKRRG